MKTKNYLFNKSKLGSSILSSRIYVTLAALLIGSTMLAQTPEMVSGSPLNAKGFTELGNRLYFNGESSSTGDRWLYSTTGSSANIHSGYVSSGATENDPSNMIAFNGQLIHRGYQPNSGSGYSYELASFNHTSTYDVYAFPELIKNINSGGDSNPRGLTELNGNLYFSADDGINGRELWITDGTEAGTQLLKDINTGSQDGNPNSFIEYNGNLIFEADNGTDGTELWITDGTSQGTEMLIDIRPGSQSSNPHRFIEFDNKIFFTANDGTNGRELWATDGTASGTSMVKDMYPGPQNIYPSDFIVYNGMLYFNASNDVNGREIWVSDGTQSGTSMLKDLNPGGDSSSPTHFQELDGLLYFFADDGTDDGLWVTDGTSTGTTLVVTVSSMPYQGMTNYDGRLYYVTNDANGDGKLWVTDGSASGTELAPSPNVAPNDSPFPNGPGTYNSAVFNGSFYFTADYDNSGLKLYKLTTNNLGIKDYETIDFVIHPNPVEDVLYLESGSNQISEIILFSITGQRLQSWEGKSEINLSEYNSGNYLVKITTENNKSVTKQIIKK
ncbi:ELWxxDGT repeat protein [Psychroflexus halocasei]|uniref:Por secretion system C-terminal sorting domain-containing protein n=1 Tax=Psychroflexus halocasei TaxID=908615 RepID=A0A1H4AFS0_9FLAO|nr:ELWxxDGT repeat protein [Psychroflexus halocasei]SEA34855.1 Por secretion system C-terminal sorting domain-containing protein [Psychroflexus halocasei]